MSFHTSALIVSKSWRSYVYRLANRFTIHWQTTWYLRTLMRTQSTRSSGFPSGHSVNIVTYIWKRTHCYWSMSLKIFVTVTSRIIARPHILLYLIEFYVGRILKHTGIRFKLLTDIDMVIFIERYTRWVNVRTSTREPTNTCRHMIHQNVIVLDVLDVNNLYGWAMYQPLFYADFLWVDVGVGYSRSVF